MDKDTKKNYQLYGRNDMIMLDEHNKIYGSLGMAEPYIVATKTGETLLLNGAKDNEPFIGLSLYGKSHQNTVAGNQLLDTVNAVNQKFTITGVTVTNNGDGSFTVIGTPTITAGNVFTYYITEGLVLEEGQYTLSSGIACRIDKKDGTAQYVDNTFTFDSEVDESVYIYWQRDTNNYVDGEIIWPMLNAGTTALHWEPYTGGQPSPNPDYPQEIISVGDEGEIGVDVYGGNLLDIGILTDLVMSTPKYFPIEVGSGSFTLSSNTPTENSIYNLFLLAGNVSEGASSALNGVGNGMDRTVTSVDGYVTVGARASSRNPNNPLDYDIMLNIGSTALPYEPYKQPQSFIVSTPNGLPGIPVSSGGNYTDENGQQWVSDEIDFKRRKYVKRVIKYTGPYSVTYWVESNSWFLIATRLEKIPKPEYRGFCNVSNAYYSSWDNIGYSHWFLQPSGQNIVIHLGDKYNTEEAVQQFISENEIVVYYAAETPIETDLTTEQITAYQSLHTNYPITTVVNDEGAGMKVIYKQVENGG